MLLYLVRHGEAVHAGPDADIDRPLAAMGEHQIETLGRTLARELPNDPTIRSSVGIITSPAVRCRTSAALLAAALEIPMADVQVEDDFGLGGDPRRGLQALACGTRDRGWILVSHEPTLARLCSLLLGGEQRHNLRFDPAACVCFELEAWPQDGRGVLKWFLAPEQLAILARTRGSGAQHRAQ